MQGSGSGEERALRMVAGKRIRKRFSQGEEWVEEVVGLDGFEEFGSGSAAMLACTTGGIGGCSALVGGPSDPEGGDLGDKQLFPPSSLESDSQIP